MESRGGLRSLPPLEIAFDRVTVGDGPGRSFGSSSEF